MTILNPDRWRRRWDALETIVGMLAVFFIGFLPPVLLPIIGFLTLVQHNPDRTTAIACFVGTVVSGGLALWTASMANRAFAIYFPGINRVVDAGSAERVLPEALDGPLEFHEEASLPFAVVLGMHLPHIPRLLRVPLGLWWLVHFGYAVAASVGLGFCVKQATSQPAPIGWSILLMLVSFALAFATNLYLLLSISVFEKRKDVLFALWRWRLAIDFTLALVAVVILLL